MGAGNPFYRFYNGTENYEVSTYYLDYGDVRKPNGKKFKEKHYGTQRHLDALYDAFDYYREDLMQIAQGIGFELDGKTRDAESCAGYRDEATVLAEGKFAKLLLMDGDNNRLVIGLVPRKDYDAFAQEIRDDHYYRGDNWGDEAIDAEIERRWPVYERRYATEHQKYMRKLHENYPGEYSLYARNGAWMSNGLPAYDKKNPLPFHP